jgi:hypothetical protein
MPHNSYLIFPNELDTSTARFINHSEDEFINYEPRILSFNMEKKEDYFISESSKKCKTISF